MLARSLDMLACARSWLVWHAPSTSGNSGTYMGKSEEVIRRCSAVERAVRLACNATGNNYNPTLCARHTLYCYARWRAPRFEWRRHAGLVEIGLRQRISGSGCHRAGRARRVSSGRGLHPVGARHWFCTPSGRFGPSPATAGVVPRLTPGGGRATRASRARWGRRRRARRSAKVCQVGRR